MERLVIVTWISGSWKSTLQENVMREYGYTRPINFTTRKPRSKDAIEELRENKIWWHRDEVNETEYEQPCWDFSSEELGEYIFLSQKQYFKKLANWDFLEHTNYNGNWYGVSSHLPDENMCIVLDPVWLEQVKEKMTRLYPEVKLVCIYLEINEEVQRERLEKRWDDEEKIKERMKDNKWFSPSKKSVVLDWTKSEIALLEEVWVVLKMT